MSDILKFDRQSHTDLLNDQTILADGEIKFGYYDNGCKMRIGDGKHKYKDLPDTPIKNGGVTCSDISVSIYPDLISSDEMIRFKYSADISQPMSTGNYLLKLNEIDDNIDLQYKYRYVEYANCNYTDVQLPKTLQIESVNNSVTLIIPLELYKYNSISYCKINSIYIPDSCYKLDVPANVSCNIIRWDILYENSTNIDEFTPICECTLSGDEFLPNNDVIYEECYTYAAKFVFSYSSEFTLNIYGWDVQDTTARLSSAIIDNKISGIDIPLKVECYKHEYNLSNILNYGTKYIKLVDKNRHNFYLYYYNNQYIPTFTYIAQASDKYIYGSMNMFNAYSVIPPNIVPMGYISNGKFINTLLLEYNDGYSDVVDISTGSTVNVYDHMTIQLTENSGLNNTSELYTIISQLPEELINNNNLMFSKDIDYSIRILADTVSESMYVLLVSDIQLPITYLKYDKGNLIIHCSESFYSAATILLCTSYGKPIKKYEVSIVCTEY